ncbi:MAG TPA: hypothetical protein VHD62_18330 [Opitutaceae bacterium]|nr:hypothetical protein [Opitutaceae bacterium]
MISSASIFRGVTAGGAIVALCGGCRHVAVAPVPIEGRSSFKFIEPAAPEPEKRGASEGPRQPVNALVPPEPIEPLATPVYPSIARGATSLIMMVGVRITVGPDGRVADIAPSFVAMSTPGPFAAEFRQAVDAAVRQWRFLPAEIRHLEPAKTREGQPIWNVTRTEKTEAPLDVMFTFSPSGEVGTALPK